MKGWVWVSKRGCEGPTLRRSLAILGDPGAMELGPPAAELQQPQGGPDEPNPNTTPTPAKSRHDNIDKRSSKPAHRPPTPPPLPR